MVGMGSGIASSDLWAPIDRTRKESRDLSMDPNPTGRHRHKQPAAPPEPAAPETAFNNPPIFAVIIAVVVAIGISILNLVTFRRRK